MSKSKRQHKSKKIDCYIGDNKEAVTLEDYVKHVSERKLANSKNNPELPDTFEYYRPVKK